MKNLPIIIAAISLHLHSGHTALVKEDRSLRCKGNVVTQTETVDDVAVSGSVASHVNQISGTYKSDTLCKTIISIPRNKTLKFQFNKLDIEESVSCMQADFLSIEQFNSRLCGQLSKDRKLWPPTYWSGLLIILFKTDFKVGRTGFNITWRVEYDPDYMPCRNRFGNGNGDESNLNITSPSGTLSSYLQRNGNYRTNEDCLWYFTAQPGYVFEFQFTKVDLDFEVAAHQCRANDLICPCDFSDSIAIHEANTQIILSENNTLPSLDPKDYYKIPSKQNYLTYRCGRQVPNYIFTGFSSLTYVHYKTQGFKEGKGSGFEFRYRQVPSPCKGVVNLQADVDIVGVIKNEVRNSTGTHRGNENCKWIISAENRVVKWWFEEFDLIDDCSEDFIRLVDGLGGLAKEIGVYCSSNVPTFGSEATAFETKTSVAVLQFKTNHVLEGQGFQLHYKAVDSDNLPCTYSTLITNSLFGNISSVTRRLDGNYRTNEDCNWLIKMEEGFSIRLIFLKIDVDPCGLDVNCPCDAIAIFDGRDKSYRPLAHLCGKGNAIVGKEFVTTGSEVLINFRTDSQLSEATGFVLTYEAVQIKSESFNSSTSWAIAASVASGLVCCLIASISVAAFIRRRKKFSTTKTAVAVGNYITPAANFSELLQQVGAADLIQKLEKISINPECLNNISDGDGGEIGCGVFGIVKKGQLLLLDDSNKTIDVAIKVLHSLQSPEILADFIKEALLMVPLDHPNVLKCLGVSIIHDQPHLVTPLMCNGSLKSYLKNLRQRSDGKEEQLQCIIVEFLRQVASGMTYMSNKGYIHRDLACRNVLIDEYLIAKISDFGLTRVVENGGNYYRATKSRILPLKWLPPEALLTGLFDMKSDVWSYGVLMWEAFNFCQQEPYYNIDSGQIIEEIASGSRLAKPEACNSFLYEKIMLQCWYTTRSQRPSFSDISGLLDEFKIKAYL